MKLKSWSYGCDGAALSTALAVIGTGFNWWRGGWGQMVQALVSFMAVDFILGFLAAAKAKTVNSQVMFWGGVNKILVLIFVGVGVMLDGLLGVSDPAVRTAVIWFYIGREGLSVTENYGKMGLPLPPAIAAALEQIKQKGGEKP